MLDESNIIKDQYFLEISSPGVERHIRKDSHLEQSIGKDVVVKLYKPLENKKKEIIGKLIKFDENTITIDNITIQRDNISSMKRDFKW